MNRIKTKALVFLLFTASVPLAAQTTLDACRSMARAHYPAVARYDLVGQTRELTLRTAAKGWLPHIVVGAQASWQNAVASFPEQLTGVLKAGGLEVPGMRKEQYQLSLQLDQPVWDGGRSRAEKALALAQDKVESGGLDADFYALEQRIDELFFGVLMLDGRIAQSEDLTALLSVYQDRVRSLEKHGVARPADAESLQAERLLAEEQLAGLRAARKRYLTALSLFVGKEVDSLERPAARISGRTSVRPEWALLDAREAALNAQRKLADVSVKPRFSLFAQGWFGYPGLDMFRSMTASDPTWNAIVGLRMNWNVSAFFTRRDALRKISLSQARLQVDRDLFTFDNTLRTRQGEQDLARLQDAAARREEIARLRRHVRQDAESRYRNGVIGLPELMKALTDEQDAVTACTAADLEYLKTAYELNHYAL